MVKTQFIEIRNEEFVRCFDVDDAVDDPENYQPPRYIRIEKPLRNSAIIYYDPVSQTPVEDAVIAAAVKKRDFKKLRAKRNELLEKTDWTQNLDAPLSDDERAMYQTYRQKLRDITQTEHPYYIEWPVPLLDGAVYIADGSVKAWVTDEGGPLEPGDGLVASNVVGYCTKGEPAVVTIKDPCDFSNTTTETYYSNIVSVTQSNVLTTSETEEPGYVENSYWTSNTISHYTGNAVSHYTNVVVYDGVSVYTNVQTAQEGFTPVMVSNTSPVEIEGYTPVLVYSNVSSDRYDANVHTEYTKVITHYSNISVVEEVTYSNITAAEYANLSMEYVVTPGYTEFINEASNTTIRVEQYSALTPEQRAEYTVQPVAPVTSNLQTYYTAHTREVPHTIRELEGGIKARYVSCGLT
jgi:hypothetical protein